MWNNFPASWKKILLEDCMSAIIDYRGKTPRKVPFGVPLITAKIIKNGRIGAIEEYIAFEDYDTWMNRGFPQAGDIVMTTEGPLGEIAQLDGSKVVPGQRVITLRGHYDLLNNTFLKFQMLSSYVQEQLLARATGTTVQGIRQSQLRKISLIIPPLSEQQAIAHILGSLDDKIELNRQMNETLESIARALFKSWFVDFDPVRAKMEGRVPYGMNAETAALFPDGFEDSRVGEIPRGWKIGRLDDLLTLQRGYDLPTNQRTSGPFPVISAGGFSGSHIEYKAQGPGVATGRSGLLGKVFFVHENFWPLNTTLYIKEYKVSSPTHAYYILSNIDFEGYNAGSAVPTLNRNHIHNLPAIVPSYSVIKAFDNLVMPLFNYCYQNKQQSTTLSTLRDTLLPKLLSGEIRVGDVEREVGAVL